MRASELHRYGFAPGNENLWCGCCTREFKGGFINAANTRHAFNCQSCAEKKYREVDRECTEAGEEQK